MTGPAPKGRIPPQQKFGEQEPRLKVVEPIKWRRARHQGVRGIVYHAMGELIHIPGTGQVLGAEEFLRDSPNLCGAAYSAHALAPPEGTIVQLAPDEDRTWHAGESRLGELVGLNGTFLGIEALLPGQWDITSFNNSMRTGNVKFTWEQYNALGWWMAKKAQVYGFGRPGCVGHQRVAGDDVRGPGRGKLDPGVGFSEGQLTNSFVAWEKALSPVR